MILVGDIGGTNTTIAAVDHDAGRFTITRKERYASAQLTGIGQALDQFLRKGGAGSEFAACCISAAGPISSNVCLMTNVKWSIDGNDVARRTGVPTFIINDFSAICYALPLIDTHPEIGTVALPHPDGSTPAPHGPVRAVVGAGTGLGTGFLIEDNGHYTAHPSEAGHSSFAPFDDEMEALRSWLGSRFETAPGAEQYISGQGIRNIYRCFRETGRISDSPLAGRIDSAPGVDIPEMVAENAPEDKELAAVMRLFVRMYARYASDTALTLLPTGGLYLAGGIAAKNERWLLEDDLFMRIFEHNYAERITPLLRNTPVALIKDYSVSLYGAAHAAISLA